MVHRVQAIKLIVLAEMLKRPNNPTYQLFIAVLSIYWRTIARHQFSDELKIFC